MELLAEIWRWVVDKEAWEWVFSGIGVSALSWLLLCYRKKPPALQDKAPSVNIHNKDGDQNIAQGKGSIGQQINNYNAPQVSPPPDPPRQLPPIEACFLGRNKELADLTKQLHPGKVAAVCGPGGMGKSALAVQAVHRLKELAPARFPDGIVFHSFYHQPGTEMALQTIADAFCIKVKAGLAKAVKDALAGRKALLILDGAEEAEDLPVLLKLRGSCGVLITSRKRSDALTPPLEIKPLKKLAAAEVFRAYSGAAANEEDDASVQGICEILSGWPVALRIAGRYLSSTGESATNYLRWLEKEPFKELGEGEHQDRNAALLLRRSVEQVSKRAQIALGLVGTLAFAPFTERPVVALLKNANFSTPWEFCRLLKSRIAHRRTWLLHYTDDDVRFGQTVLNELVNFGLLLRKDKGWEVSHALVHTYARTKMPLNRMVLKMLARYYILFARTQSAAGLEGYARLDEERAHCLRLIEVCLDRKLWQEVKALSWAINTYLDRQGHWTEKLATVGMRLTAAKQAGDRKDEAWCLNELGYTCNSRREQDKALAWFEQGLPILRQLGDRQGEGATLTNIAEIYRQQGKYELALQQYEQSLTILREIGDRQGEGVTLNNIGMLYDAQEDYETALTYYEQCLPISREVGHKILEGSTLNNIAAIYRAQGKPAKALEHHEQALKIYRELGDRAREAVTCWNIGLTYKDLGDLAKAEEHISRAVQIAEAIDHPSLEDWRKYLERVRAKRQGKQRRFTKRPSRQRKRKR